MAYSKCAFFDKYQGIYSIDKYAVFGVNWIKWQNMKQMTKYKCNQNI